MVCFPVNLQSDWTMMNYVYKESLCEKTNKKPTFTHYSLNIVDKYTQNDMVAEK